MLGIKETKEALVGVNELALYLISLLKDGVDANDAVALFLKLQSDEIFKNKLMDAYQDLKLVKGEMSDLQIGEAVELVRLQLDYVPKFVLALKQPAIPV